MKSTYFTRKRKKEEIESDRQIKISNGYSEVKNEVEYLLSVLILETKDR